MGDNGIASPDDSLNRETRVFLGSKKSGGHFKDCSLALKTLVLPDAHALRTPCARLRQSQNAERRAKRWASIEVLGDCGKSNVGDGAVRNRHCKTDRGCEDCPIALRLRQAVGMHNDRGRHGMTTL